MSRPSHLGCALAVAVGVGTAVATQHGMAMADPSASTDFPEPVASHRIGAAIGSLALADAGGPVALNGRYVLNRALDRQTFNGQPAPGIPFATDVTFSTTCDESGCTAHSNLVAKDAPLDFRWTGTAWRSVQRFDWTCDDQSSPATVTYTLTPNSNGTLAGDRTAVVDAPGCGTPRSAGSVSSPLTAVPA